MARQLFLLFSSCLRFTSQILPSSWKKKLWPGYWRWRGSCLPGDLSLAPPSAWWRKRTGTCLPQLFRGLLLLLLLFWGMRVPEVLNTGKSISWLHFNDQTVTWPGSKFPPPPHTPVPAYYCQFVRFTSRVLSLEICSSVGLKLKNGLRERDLSKNFIFLQVSGLFSFGLTMFEH